MFRWVDAKIEDSEVKTQILQSGIGLLELQIVGGPLSHDRALIDDEGVKKLVDGTPHYSQHYLRDRMGIEEFSATFNRLSRLLITLAEGKDFLLFLRHPPKGFDRTEFEEFYSLSVYCDDGLLNGSFVLHVKSYKISTRSGVNMTACVGLPLIR